MNKSFIKPRRRLGKSLSLYRLETGFSMLEAVVVVGVLLALAVGGFFAYGPITENAKKAKTKSAASEVYTGVAVADIDGDSNTNPQDVIDNWNASTDEIRVEIVAPEAGGTSSNGDFCVSATNVKSPNITARVGTCDGVNGGGDIGGTPGVDPVSQPAVMRTTWDTSIIPSDGTSCSTITLPLTGSVDTTVDWGDGTIEPVTSELPSHEYIDTPGVKSVSIDGTFTGWVGYDWPTWSAECLTQVTEWGETGTTDAEAGFAYTTNLTEVVRMPLTIPSFYDLFYSSNFNGDISDWDTSNVTNMKWMFENAASFNQPLDSWNTSKVVNMRGMFSSAEAFNQPLRSWNTSNVTDMYYMFTFATAFDQPLNNWNTSSVTDMSFMFQLASAFNQPLDNWNTSNVTDMNFMFTGASTFDQPLNNWNTSNVTDMSAMFNDASSFDQPLDNWDTSQVTDMSFMFQGDPEFNQPLNNWNTSNVTDMRAMLNKASSFDQPLDNWDTSQVTDMSFMFQGDPKFNQPLNSWSTSNVTNMSAMFNDAFLFDQPLSSWNTSSVTDMSFMFNDAWEYNQDLSGWDVGSVVEITNFSDGSSLTAANLPQWSAIG